LLLEFAEAVLGLFLLGLDFTELALVFAALDFADMLLSGWGSGSIRDFNFSLFS
jgi:hypothetical protein